MLTHLELVGFKSFADKTRLDFSPGVTGVVGPNGSGKSNVVDAVRWVLGEQSAKTLRGGEMADVIFTGSATRRGLGLAEVTVGFDNSRRLLAVDADEVRVTRRVYRDGTGDYLINGQTSRLKDVRDVFLGSGAGAGGYTVIAQGRVDELLAASARDRREIFDEAAGISRFKARKAEALRKLLATESNLARSRDRLDGLDAQLRTLKLQASKAQKYQEYSGRLRDLRVGLAAREYRDLSAALEAEQAALAELTADAGGSADRAAALEQAVRDRGAEVDRLDAAVRQEEAGLADARQRIAGFEATARHERVTAAGHEAELVRLGRQRMTLGYRVRELEAEAAGAEVAAVAAEEHLRAAQQAAAAAEAELAAAAGRVATLDEQSQADRDRQFDLARRAGAARSRATAELAQVDRLQKEYTRKLGESDHAAARRTALAATLDGMSRADADLRARLGEARDRLSGLQAARDALAADAERAQKELEDLRVRQGDYRGRVEILEGLERSLDGVGAGVRVLLEATRSTEPPIGFHSGFRAPGSAFSQVVGLIADLLTVPREVADAVELALGDAAQRFVVADPAAVDALAAAAADLPGRVGFVPVRGQEAGDRRQQEGERSGFGPSASCLLPPDPLSSKVRCDHPGLAGLPDQLLGDVYLVPTLTEARRLAAGRPGCRFVTPAGELLEPDGTLTAGPVRSGAGLVSRKSELRDLRGRLAALAGAVAAAEAEVAALRRRADGLAGEQGAAESEIELLSDEAGDLQQALARQRQQVEQQDELLDLLRTETAGLEREVQRGEAGWLEAKTEADEAEAAADELGRRLAGLRAALAAAEADRDRCHQAHTAAQVAAGRAAADRDRAKDKAAQLAADRKNRKIEWIDAGSNAHNARLRLRDADLTVLRAEAGLADSYREKEVRERRAADLGRDAVAARAARDATRDELDELRAGWQERQAAAHTRELAARELAARRDAVAARVREDYGLEVSSFEFGVSSQPTPADPADEPAQLETRNSKLETEEEIDDLKKKLARLGNVNLEALDELARVEAEHAGLKAQHDDLAAARKSLQEVIDAINAESRKLFSETLEAVRGYFQELFRKLFGGGQADIVLEDGADILEGGVDVTARPPGKELRSLSLLSGGEKTLTAVALLLAIFRAKPSPFCILDEVDAALDEANTARLAGVLREFLDRSQFIVVTHRKRTMAAADRLWGVTMQEGGVSRVLPMRFEDWPEEAEPARAAA